MPTPRIFQASALQIETAIQLDEQAMHHLVRVLRAKKGDDVILFNGEGGEYEGMITHIDKKKVIVDIKTYIPREVESHLELYLAQGISRGDKMDYTIQKAVELGIKKIIPVITERCNVKLDEERREKRWQHWNSILIGACEQCGRNQLPELQKPQLFSHFLAGVLADQKWVLAPHAENTLSTLAVPKDTRIVLLIGPEGGLTEHEIHQARQQGFVALQLGPRILRTETAAVAAISALQYAFGDFR